MIIFIGRKKQQKSLVEKLKRKCELAEMEAMALHKSLLDAEWQVEVLRDLNTRLQKRIEIQEKIIEAVSDSQGGRKCGILLDLP